MKNINFNNNNLPQNDGKLIYEGEYLNGEKNGKGKEYNWQGELELEGEYLKGRRNGKGKKYYFKQWDRKS